MKKLKRFVVRGSIKNGVYIPDNDKYERGMIAMFQDTKNVRRIYEAQRSKRSVSANNYYWGVVLDLISEHTGFLPEELHEVFKSKFLREKRKWRGSEMTTLKSTALMSTDEFSEFIQQVIREGNEMGVEIPDADENYDLKETTRID